MAQADLSEQILGALWNELVGNTLYLPTLPDIATRIDALVRDPDADLAHIADEIRRDPAIAAQVIRMANNAAYRGGAPIAQLHAAITRIGLDATRTLVRGLALHQLFSTDSAVLQGRLRAAWARSMEVAAVAHLLARRYGGLDADTALLAGPVHNVGVLPVLRYVERAPHLLRSDAAIDLVIERLQGRAGQLLLSTWGFPPELLPLPEECLHFGRVHRGERPDYVDLVSVSILRLDVRHEGLHARVDRRQVPAFARLGIDPDLDVFALEGFEAEYRALLAALTG